MKNISVCAAAALLPLLAGTLSAQSAGAAKLRGGKEIYQAGCAGCHGREGAGAPHSTTGFARPETFPDFSRCDQTTAEDNLTWKSIIRDGGPSRGFSRIMPSFREALSPDQIDAVIGYLRGFCRQEGWPRGEFNLPRPLLTEKAFPENEFIITTALNAQGAPQASNEIVQEQRFGRRNQVEIALPVEFQRPERGRWYGGVGDFSIGLKRVLFADLRKGSILSVQTEVKLPTGNAAHGLGAGTPVFENFAAFGQLLPWKSFLQFQAGADLPVDTSKAPKAVFMRTALGKSFNQSDGVGRMWSPMLEFTGDRDLQTGARTNWDVMPEMQVTLSRRQHVRLNVGLSVPATNTSGRQMQVMFYLLWDWQDGKLFEGWK